MDFQYRYTRHQVLRESRPDARVGKQIYLLKQCVHLGLTYQVQFLANLATESRQKLMIEVPHGCVVSRGLAEFIRLCGKSVVLRRL